MAKIAPEIYDELNRAIKLHSVNMLEEAKAIYCKILKKDSNDANALNLLGVLKAQEGLIDEAIDLIKKAISICENPLFLNNLGTVLLTIMKFNEAEQLFLRSIFKNREYIDPVINLGKLYHEKGEYDKSEERYRSIFEIAKNRSDFWCNYGNLKRDMGENEKAKGFYRKSIKIDGEYFDPLFNLAMMNKSEGDIKGAIKLFEKAKSLPHKGRRANWYLSQCYLLLGQFDKGWSLYESRFHEMGHGSNFIIPKWTGERLKTSKLLVWSEQGIGDELMFSGLISDLSSRVENVDYECDARLKSLFTRTYPRVRFIAEPKDHRSVSKEYDFHCPIGDLPKILSIQEKQSKNFLLLKTSQQQDAQFRFNKTHNASKSKILIGLSYKSFSAEGNHRTPEAKFWGPILKAAHADFFDLQNPPTSSDSLLNKLGYKGKSNVPLKFDYFNDFDELASLISSMDMVLTIDNYIAHLAGRLGKKTIILLPASPNWRWLLNRSNSIWYPNDHLIRQSSPGDWSGVQSQVMGILEGLRGRQGGSLQYS